MKTNEDITKIPREKFEFVNHESELNPKYTLFDTKSGKVLFENCNQIVLYEIGDKTYINVCTDNSSALYDGDLKLVRKAYFE